MSFMYKTYSPWHIVNNKCQLSLLEVTLSLQTQCIQPQILPLLLSLSNWFSSFSVLSLVLRPTDVTFVIIFHLPITSIFLIQSVDKIGLANSPTNFFLKCDFHLFLFSSSLCYAPAQSPSAHTNAARAANSSLVSVDSASNPKPWKYYLRNFEFCCFHS